MLRYLRLNALDRYPFYARAESRRYQLVIYGRWAVLT